MTALQIDIEPALVRSAQAHVEAELRSEFPKAARSRGDKLATARMVEGRLDGDEVRAVVREQGEAYRVRLTLPLFGGTSVTQCECARHVTANGDPRCAHVWATHRVLADGLAELAERNMRAAGHEALFDAFDEFMGPTDDLLTQQDEMRLMWRVATDDSQLTVVPYLQTRLDGAPWERALRGRRLGWAEMISMPALWSSQADHLAAARVKPQRLGGQDDFEVDVFGLLEDLDGHPLVAWDGDDESKGTLLTIEAGTIGLAVRPTNEDDGDEAGSGIVVASHINALPVARQWIFDGKGYATLVDGGPSAPRRLLFTRCNRTTTDLLTKLERTSRAVPVEEKERLLSYLVRLEQKLAVAVAETLVDPSPIPANNVLHVRLTPMQPSGLKVELLVRPSPTGGYFPVGAGPETVLDVTEAERPRNVGRDMDCERELGQACVEELGLDRLPCVHGHIWFLRGDDAALDLVRALEAYVDPGRLVVLWPKYAQKSEQRAYELAAPLEAQSFHLAIGEGRDWFDVKGGVDVEGQLVDLKDLIDAIKRKTRYIRLRDGRWAHVTNVFEARLAKVASLLEEQRDGFAIPAASLPELLAWDPAEEQVRITAASESWQRARRHFISARDMPCPVPTELQATLRAYQIAGYQWMARLAAWGMGGCLADDMGLGKTVQTLAVLLRLAGNGPSLVIAPTSVGPNWAKEARRFAPSLNVIMYRETDRRGGLEGLKAGDLVICSYGLAQRDIERLEAFEWNTIVFDEAQAMKNFQTKTAQAMRRLNASWRIALTGTPIENGLSELWSIFRIVAPGMLGSWEAFKKSYAMPVERFGLEGARLALEARLRPYILRRMKEQHLTELPPKTEIDLSIELGDEERRLYDAVRLRVVQDLETRRKKAEERGEEVDHRMAVLAALTKLRQIACHPRLFDPEWQGGASKLAAFVETCRMLKANGHRALVFSQFTSHLQLLGDALRSIGASYLYLDGAVAQRRRMELVDAFQGGETEFFLISVKAGGTGLNLTAADYVLHMDPWWNPAVEDQATDRAHRMGQLKPLTVYRFVTAGTVEEKILELHETKRDLADSVLTTDQIASLLGG